MVMTSGLTMNYDGWSTASIGSEEASVPVGGDRLWLRVQVDIRPGSGGEGNFSYSTDGVNFTPIGSVYALNNDWQFFMGYRFGVFNHATQSLGGSVTVESFQITSP